ncbi:MAG TPA: iron ABC transporter permease [Bryobacteraceae bacterium]|nr:iron ABC transporter permease [Bryobacteraceae bacterium]
MEARRVWTVLGICSAVAFAATLGLPLIGSSSISYTQAWAGVEPDHAILFEVRLPRVLLSMLTGGALALGGVLFQALLRDALATPYTLGVSAGASFGAVLAISLGMQSIWMSSMAGAAITLFIVLGVAMDRRGLSPFTLLLAGVTINSICMAGIVFLHSFATFGQSFAIARWLMGGVESVSMSTLSWLAACVLPLALFCFSTARDWNLIAVGDEWAAARGVNTGRTLMAGYIIGSILTGAVTALTGPIGFVGLIVPHAIRLGFGADHRLLAPASFLIGAVFLAVCDTIARVALAPAEVPVGVITSLVGGPVFIWILRTR